jgi:VIT1/CCC1 family predicted Fe2+/Mn2+ transporter
MALKNENCWLIASVPVGLEGGSRRGGPHAPTVPPVRGAAIRTDRLRPLAKVRPAPGTVAPVRAIIAAPERHLSHRASWLRAAVLGANDGIVSTASLVLGVAASGASASTIVTAGIAGLVAGALSMAAGEYVSVSSQRDAEEADIRLERRELGADPEGELAELGSIYERRGLPPALAREVAEALSTNGALEAHLRDELGLSEERLSRPLQAAWASALSFSMGAALPVVAVAVAPAGARVIAAVTVTLVALAVLGAAGARLGGAPAGRATLRVVVWGAIAMAITSAIGALVGTVA